MQLTEHGFRKAGLWVQLHHRLFQPEVKRAGPRSDRDTASYRPCSRNHAAPG